MASMQTWTPEQVRSFLATAEADGDRLSALYVLALSTGLRQSQLFGLRWDDVDLDNAEITVSVAVQRSRRRGVRLDAKPKTANARRTLPLVTAAGLSAADVLEAVPKHWQDELAWQHGQDSSHRPAMGLHPAAPPTARAHWTPRR